MAIKKTVKKRSPNKKSKVQSFETILSELQTNTDLTPVIKRAVVRHGKSTTAQVKQQKTVATHEERVQKARDAIQNSKTPTAKEKARMRLSQVQGGLKEAKENLATTNSELKKAERLLKGLYKELRTIQSKMQKDFDKSAKSLEKNSDKPLRRRKPTTKKLPVEPEL